MTEIIVYSTQTCMHCKMLKNWLSENKIEFKEVDVGRDREAAQKMIEKSGQMGVPVVEIDGEFLVGFNKEKLKEKLNL